MRHTRLMTRLSALVDRLTMPSPRLTDPVQRRKARLLASFSAAAVFTVIVFTPPWLLLMPGFDTAPMIALGLIVALVVVYGLSRTPCYRSGAVLLVVSIFALVITSMLTSPYPMVQQVVGLNYLVIAVIMSDLFLSRRATLLIVLLSLLLGSSMLFTDAPAYVVYAFLVFFVVLMIVGAISAGVARLYRQQLTESEERYRSVVAALSEGVVLQGQDGAILACNAAAERILGLSAEQMAGRCSVDPRWQAIHEDGSPFPGESHPAMVTLRTGEPQYGVIMGVHHPTDDLRWISINSQPLTRPNESQPYAVVTSFTDITARRRTAQALHESEARQSALLSALPDLVFRIDRNGTYLDYHARNLSDLAVPPEQFLGRTVYEVLSEDVADVFMRAIRRAIDTGKETIVEYTLTLHDQPLQFEARCVAINQNEALSIIRNITERKQAQAREFEYALEKERMNLLTGFIRDAAHEFRTPLSVINSSAYLMIRAQDEAQREMKAAQISEQVERITRLVDLLLLMARLESTQTLATQPVKIAGILPDVCEKMGSQCTKSHRLEKRIPAELPDVAGDALYLTDAFRQILDNACRYTPENGVITVSAGAEDAQVWVEVHDTGIGIPETALPHVFKTFWRHDDAHTTPGFGLGLSIAQKIIERHGGAISVSSAVGQGTVVRVILPALIGPPEP